jgi:fucose permease
MVVGIDVGMNVTIPKYLMLKGGLPLEQAGLGTSLYFISRTLGTVLGAILLTRIPVGRFYIITAILALCSLVFTLLMSSIVGICIGVFLIGLTVANIFPVIYSTAMFYKPQSRGEVSGLMMMGVVGGAIVPLFIGIASDKFGLTAGMAVLGLCTVYLILNALTKKQQVQE